MFLHKVSGPCKRQSAFVIPRIHNPCQTLKNKLYFVQRQFHHLSGPHHPQSRLRADPRGNGHPYACFEKLDECKRRSSVKIQENDQGKQSTKRFRFAVEFAGQPMLPRFSLCGSLQSMQEFSLNPVHCHSRRDRLIISGFVGPVNKFFVGVKSHIR